MAAVADWITTMAVDFLGRVDEDEYLPEEPEERIGQRLPEKSEIVGISKMNYSSFSIIVQLARSQNKSSGKRYMPRSDLQ